MKAIDGTLRVGVVLLVVCACTLTGLTVRRELGGAAHSGMAAHPKPVPVKDWESYAVGGHRVGPDSVQAIVVEFADFECPYCAAFANGPLRAMRTKYPGQFAVVFRNWPLSIHRFAYPTARAAECAALQGRFEAFHDLVFLKQDSLGLKSYRDFARDAGVPNVSVFERCNANAAPLQSIADDSRAAELIGATGTPTILINGMMLAGAPDTTTFERELRKAMGRKE